MFQQCSSLTIKCSPDST